MKQDNPNSTVNLGFGCVRLTSNYTKKQALRNLETAYENGIRHFDVAPLYGFGLAEGMLGEFVKNKRDTLTITTKFGILANNSVLKNLFLQNIIRSAYRVVKKSKLKNTTQSIASSATMTPKDFSVANAEKSLNNSLKELKTNYIDYYVMHEPLISDANNAELIDFLENKKRQGVIKEFGIASFSDIIEKEFNTLNSAHTVLQTSNSFPFSVPESLERGPQIKQRFYFSPLQYLNQVKTILHSDEIFARSISDKLGFDCKKQLIDVFLMHQYASTVNGITLFTSSSNEKIIGTIDSWNRVKNLPPNAFEQFTEIQKRITNRLLQTK
ncbi:aldo/keto reductase [Cytophaga aurantiaca]|uniref:aldo/keto reductase n=1 Tax=Cytophaga aurantiaca TaxID=29530 RepID=UPI000379B4D5|nr:aldo/keto reductase [Cytophaga aurantiaca]